MHKTCKLDYITYKLCLKAFGLQIFILNFHISIEFILHGLLVKSILSDLNME
jgi:hypothetical protein